jgi:hypothetical protein
MDGATDAGGQVNGDGGSLVDVPGLGAHTQRGV